MQTKNTDTHTPHTQKKRTFAGREGADARFAAHARDIARAPRACAPFRARARATAPASLHLFLLLVLVLGF